MGFAKLSHMFDKNTLFYEGPGVLEGLSNTFTLLGTCVDRVGIFKPVLQDIIPRDLGLLLSPHYPPVLL